METTEYKSFIYFEDESVHFSGSTVSKITKKLDSGAYRLSAVYINNICTPKLSAIVETTDIKYHDFEGKERIDEIFNLFFRNDIKEKVESIGFCHKLGLLFYGKEGTGKTSIMRQYYNKAISEQNAIVFYIGDVKHDAETKLNICWEFVSSIRKMQNNPIVIVLDEFDGFVYESESFWKKVLDGIDSISNTIFLASTNYIDMIPEAIKSRPSRFKYVIEMKGIESVNTIIGILKPMLSNVMSDAEIVEFANTLKGDTLDVIKNEALDRLMMVSGGSGIKKSSKKCIGFKSGSNTVNNRNTHHNIGRYEPINAPIYG